MTVIDVRTLVTLQCGGGTITLEPDGWVTAAGPGGTEASVLVPELARSSAVELWCGEDYAYFVGPKDRSVWFARPAVGYLAKVLELDRLDLRGGYDPGGLHRVEFVEVANDLLIVYEFGLARVGPDGNTRWQKAHDDLTARLDRVAGEVVWLTGESGSFGFKLADGRSVTPT